MPRGFSKITFSKVLDGLTEIYLSEVPVNCERILRKVGICSSTANKITHILFERKWVIGDVPIGNWNSEYTEPNSKLVQGLMVSARVTDYESFKKPQSPIQVEITPNLSQITSERLFEELEKRGYRFNFRANPDVII